MRIVKENAQRIRKEVLKYLMVRRTRDEIQRHFADDLSKQGIRFPEIEAPRPVFYQLNEEEDEAFDSHCRVYYPKAEICALHAYAPP